MLLSRRQILSSVANIPIPLIHSNTSRNPPQLIRQGNSITTSAVVYPSENAEMLRFMHITALKSLIESHIDEPIVQNATEYLQHLLTAYDIATTAIEDDDIRSLLRGQFANVNTSWKLCEIEDCV